ncbi:mitochondrial mRNA pseudouridine synthase Rpusd3-like isoform X2 [Lineus longissimus]
MSVFNHWRRMFPSQKLFTKSSLLQGMTSVRDRKYRCSQCRYVASMQQSLSPRNECEISKSSVQTGRHSFGSFPGANTESSNMDTLTDLLLENVIFENGHVVAVNKPNGLSLHIKREGSMDDEALGLTDVIPLMKQRLNVKHLETVVGINRKYSGVILLAKSKEVCQKLKKFYTSSVPAQQILPYTFWGLTVRVPKPDQGTDKFTVTRKQIGSHLLTYTVDNPSNRAKERGAYLNPFIKYEVLDRTTSTKCALVELRPTTGKWDVIPLYIVKKLATLLGDHVYSSRLRTVLGRPVFQEQYTAIPETQILSKLIFQSLKTDWKDIEKIPLHLHHKKLIVPKLSRKVDSVEIEAPLPDFFMESMIELGFSDEYLKQTKAAAPDKSGLVEGLVEKIESQTEWTTDR